MSHAIKFYETGSAHVLHIERADIKAPDIGEVLIKHTAVGLNFADIYYRRGLYPSPLPSGLGIDGAGIIEAVGAGVTDFKVGDRVTYTGSPLGAYSTHRTLATKYLIKLPDEISFDIAAAVTTRGLTAAYLLKSIYSWKPGDAVLLHAAAGGVGQIVSQWAKLLGIQVIGTVSNDEKAQIALEHGVDHVINYRQEDVAARVRELTNGVGVPVVLDSIGKDTYQASLNSLKRRGILVGFGTASGVFPPIDARDLVTRGSLFFTRPGLADYIADPVEKAELVNELFGHVAAGRIKVNIHQRYSLDDAVHAHEQLESGKTVGASIFEIT